MTKVPRTGETGATNRPVVRHVSDTAHWVAGVRAKETERADALFHDPFAGRLCDGAVHAGLPRRGRQDWPLVMRTVLFDRMIAGQVAHGVDTVVNLAAGLDTRPYRMALPPRLQWIEVDLPDILDEKEQALAGEKPVCELQRLRVDLADDAERRGLLRTLSARGSNILVVTEGLLVYLEADAVRSLAADLAQTQNIRRWLLDIVSPRLVRLMQKRLDPLFGPDVPKLKFAPPEGLAFFAPDWRECEVHAMLEEAARHGRLPPLLRLFAHLKDTPGRRARNPWSGVCLLGRD